MEGKADQTFTGRRKCGGHRIITSSTTNEVIIIKIILKRILQQYTVSKLGVKI